MIYWYVLDGTVRKVLLMHFLFQHHLPEQVSHQRAYFVLLMIRLLFHGVQINHVDKQGVYQVGVIGCRLSLALLLYGNVQ